MKNLTTLIASLAILIFFTACGENKKTSDNQKLAKDTPKNAINILTAGDDQNILEGSTLFLSMSVLNRDKVFQKQTWKKEDKVLSSNSELKIDNLPLGKHLIMLEAVDKEGVVYVDTITVVVKQADANNKPPVANDLSFVLNEDERHKTFLKGSDDDGDELNYVFVSLPKYGKLSGSSANLHYIPDENFNGSDSFRFKTNDSKIDSQLATVSITVNSVNDAPILSVNDITLLEDSSLELNVTAIDVDNDSLNITIVTPPQNGTFNDGIYRPYPNFFGEDSITFKANDGEKDSKFSTSTITVTSVNDIPKWNTTTPLTNAYQDKLYEYNLSVWDIENDVTITTSNPLPLWLTLDGTRLFGTPTNDDVGMSETMAFIASDGEESSTYSFAISVNNVNDIPLASSQNITLNEDHTIDIILSGIDINNDNLTFSYSQPTNGTFDGTTYTPNLNYFGSDSFTFTASDINSSSLPSFVNISIISVNDAPIANSDINQTNEDSNITFNLLANDTDIDNNSTLILVDINITENISFTTDGNLTFSPIGSFDYLIKDEEHNVTFSYTMRDEYNVTSDANVTITIVGINDIPTVTTVELINIYEDIGTGWSGQIITKDTDNTTLTFDSNDTLLQIDSNGTYIYDASSIDYSFLAEDETKIISIMITISDGKHNISQEVNITIIGKNTPPVANVGMRDINITIGETLSFDASQSFDIDGNITQYIWENGSTLLSNNSNFINNSFEIGTYDITLTVIDDKGSTNTDNLIITVTPTIIPIEKIPFTKKNIDTTRNILKFMMADLDKDGDLDILANSQTEVFWYENSGNNNFNKIISVATGNNINISYATDIDNDGYLDILYAGNFTKFCINQKNKTFTCPEYKLHRGGTPIDNITSITVANIDAIYGVDIIVSSIYKKRIDVFENNGTNLIFDGKTINSGLDGINSIDSADFDNDGDIDIVASAYNSNKVVYYDNNGSGNFTKTEKNVTNAMSVSIADIDKNGSLDIISTSKYGKVYWHKSTTTNSFLVASDLTKTNYASGVDMDKDGNTDILTSSNKSGGKILWYKNSGGTTIDFEEKIIDGDVDYIKITKAIDIDNDGDIDVIALDANGNIYFYENNRSIEIKLISLTSGGNFTKDFTNNTVRDNTTGLLWQDDTTITKTWDNALTYCKNNGWRLPSVLELYTILDRSNTNPAINSEFQNIDTDNAYWTSTILNSDNTQAWYIDFTDQGDDYFGLKNTTHNIRCVQGKSLTTTLIRDDNKEVVLDKQHKLMWHDSETVSTIITNWDNAMNICSNLNLAGFTDWYLPNINELYSIIDRNKTNLVIKDAFTYSGIIYWSSTESNDNINKYQLDFQNGNVENKIPEYLNHVRCVREIP